MLECWELMMTNAVISKIVVHTNQKIFQYQTTTQALLRPSVTSDTEAREIRAFFGLMYLRSAEGKSLRSLEQVIL